MLNVKKYLQTLFYKSWDINVVFKIISRVISGILIFSDVIIYIDIFWTCMKGCEVLNFVTVSDKHVWNIIKT